MRPTTHQYPAPAKTVRDPICGMDIDPHDAVEVIDGHYFCSSSCARRYREGQA